MFALARTLVLAAALSLTALTPAAAAPAAPEPVEFSAPYEPGSIVIINSERRLYYVIGGGMALRYPVAVGKAEEIWTGKTFVQAKAENPTWRHPDGGPTVEGGPDNPLGVRAMYLGWTLWRIHGTPKRWSIGQAVSNGCIRMLNEHVTDLYERVHIGAPVYVVASPADLGKDLNWGKKLVAGKSSN
jgi:lipoprotein-anchoring transpeptidase ErfK/SrfK